MRKKKKKMVVVVGMVEKNEAAKSRASQMCNDEAASATVTTRVVGSFSTLGCLSVCLSLSVYLCMCRQVFCFWYHHSVFFLLPPI